VRDPARRVKRWQGGALILRWTAAGVVEAVRHFRKVAGFRALPKLAAALRAHDAVLDHAPRVEKAKSRIIRGDGDRLKMVFGDRS
jgi:hypothetical protein